PNANTWVGGRVGQCSVGMDINGYGNIINQVTIEGCNIAFKIGYSRDINATAVLNKIISCYIEIAQIAFDMGHNSRACQIETSFMTGVKSKVSDKGFNNKID